MDRAGEIVNVLNILVETSGYLYATTGVGRWVARKTCKSGLLDVRCTLCQPFVLSRTRGGDVLGSSGHLVDPMTRRVAFVTESLRQSTRDVW